MARRMRAPERRRQLLETAADLFARKGYRATTTAELAKAARITEPILYRHFKNKRQLFTTLLDEVGDEVIASWRAALEAAPDPAGRLAVILGGNPATHERGRGIYRVIFHAMTESDNDAAILKALRSHVGKLQAFVEEEIVKLQRAGVVRKGDATAIASLLVDVAVGFGMLTPLGVPGHTTRTDASGLLEMLNQMVRG